jgi:hypothetical protein
MAPLAISSTEPVNSETEAETLRSDTECRRMDQKTGHRNQSRDRHKRRKTFPGDRPGGHLLL